MTNAEAVEIVSFMTSNWPRPEVNAMTMSLWAKALQDLDAEVAQSALLRLMQSATFRPSIAEIREAALELRLGAARPGLDAYEDVNLAVRKVGWYGTPVFEDPIVERCVRALGWKTICETASSGEMALRSQFVKLYDELASQERKEAQVSPDLRLPEREHPAGLMKPGAEVSEQIMKSFNDMNKEGEEDGSA